MKSPVVVDKSNLGRGVGIKNNRTTRFNRKEFTKDRPSSKVADANQTSSKKTVDLRGLSKQFKNLR